LPDGAPEMRPHLWVVCSLGVALPALAAAQKTRPGTNAGDLERLAKVEFIRDLPPVDSVAAGGLSISQKSTHEGTVVARGPVLVGGRVNGSVVSLGGDVTVQRGGVVTGDALAVGGRVIADSGVVMGEMRSMSALPSLFAAGAPALVPRTPVQRTLDGAKMVAASFGVLLVIAVGVLLFAGTNLDEVVATLERRFARAFWVGLVGQLLVLPALVVLVVALALTLIGILLIPFAIVAYAVAVAGLVTLGFLAVARLVGGSVRPAGDATPRARALFALAVGIAIFFVLWMVGALLAWAPLAATVVRAAALAMTWAAMTLGLGAAILSRAGTHRKVAAGAPPVELASWQTPTPLTGVVAARRPRVTEAR
jgi:hypothetical protein